MKHLFKIVYILALISASSFTACGQDDVISKEITMKEFKKMITTNPGQIIDVRTKGEVAKGIIPGSINIDFFNDDFEKLINELDKTKPVYVYCAAGGRSGESVDIFKKNGFNEIYDLYEGYGKYAKLEK